MPVHEPLTVSALIEAIGGIDGANDLPVKISNYEGDHGMHVYTIRKHVVTDEDGEVTDAYVVING